MSMEKESNFLDRGLVGVRARDRMKKIEDAMDNTKSGTEHRALSDKLQVARKKLKIVEGYEGNNLGRKLRGLASKSGKALKVMRKAFIRV